MALALLMGSLASCSISARVKRADKKFAIGEYYDASGIYKKCYSRIPQKDRSLKAHVAYQEGECNRILNNQRATVCYQNAIKCKYNDAIVYLRLAQTLQYQGKYREAEKNYRKYLEHNPDSYVAKSGMYACSQMSDWKKIPTRIRVNQAKHFTYKKSSNFAPSFIGEDNNTIMFTSNRQPKQKSKKLKRNSPVTGQQTFNLFSSRKDANGRWLDILPAEGLSGEEKKEEETESKNDSTSQQAGTAELGVCSFTADGKTMYFTFSQPINGQDLGTKIFRSDRAGGEWGEPQEVKLFADSTISVGHPAINATGDTMFFVSDAPGGMGGKDIWRAEEEGGKWINITNMGPQINTSADELFPTLRKDGRLYFSSNGHPGYGGLDIFIAIPNGHDTIYLYNDSTQSPRLPQYTLSNMGLPVNSQGDDFGITFEGTKDNGFFSSNRGQKKGVDFIYSFTTPEVIFALEGNVLDDNGEPLSDAILRLVGDDGTNVKMQVRRDGTYRTRLNSEVHYVMMAASRGHLNQKQTLNTLGMNESHTYTQDFRLAPVSRPVKMNNVFYEFGKWELTDSSSEELMGLVRMLQDNPNITIELGAHTDMVGDSISNLTLSKKRAEACVAFLIQHGIEAERLTAVGYGESMPVVADQAMHKQYSFIPQEQVLNETFISSLTKEQQEVCNQINRRTEFKVLKTTYKLY